MAVGEIQIKIYKKYKIMQGSKAYEIRHMQNGTWKWREL